MMTGLIVPKNFKDWACSFSGCDGGNINAATWLCGIEWGGGSYGEGKYYKEELPKEIANGKVYYDEDQPYDWKYHTSHRYGISFAKLYAAIKGKKVEEYKNLVESTWEGYEIFKLNLYPIAFDSTDENLWQKYKLDTITGFDEKYIFQTWCFVNRFPYFSDLRRKHKPKLIIGTGISFLRDFFICFGGNKKTQTRIQYDEIEPDLSAKVSKKRRFYWVNIDEHSTLVVIPFFSGSYGLNSNHLLQEMGNRIRAIVPSISN
jgi:hypothetical protein